MTDALETQRYQLGHFTTTVEFHDNLVSLATLLADAPTQSRVYIIDAAVARLHSLPDAPYQYLIEVDEAQKSMPAVEAALQWLFARRIRRDATVCAIGGGVLTDLAAFVASIYQRGVALRLYPTTLLGMLDASFGGKTGINYAGYKNMVGTFYPARRIVIAPHVLTTLPPAELTNGLAEAIKSAILGDPELFGLLRLRRAAITANPPDLSLLRQVAHRSLSVKARLVSADFTEQGSRALLNLGHTFAHALESSGAFARFPHGRAVAWGINQALRLGLALNLTDPAFARTVAHLLGEYGYPLALDVDWDDLVSRMKYDKKAHEDSIRFVIPRAIGRNEIVALEPQRALSLLKESPALTP